MWYYICSFTILVTGTDLGIYNFLQLSFLYINYNITVLFINIYEGC